jgi:hypothetical protein
VFSLIWTISQLSFSDRNCIFGWNLMMCQSLIPFLTWSLYFILGLPVTMCSKHSFFFLSYLDIVFYTWPGNDVF